MRKTALPNTDVLLVCSSGGHFLQLWHLSRGWSDLTCAWVTLRSSDTESLLAGEHVVYAYGPTERNVWNLLRNVGLAVHVLRGVRPAAVVSTGAAVAIPFAWVAWAMRIPVVYVESLARVNRPSLTCRLIRPAVRSLYVQWPELQAAVPEARYAGTIFGEL